MSKKIAIVTWQIYNNYGGVLQAYALRKILLNMNCSEVHFIDYKHYGKKRTIKERISFNNLIEKIYRHKYKDEMDITRRKRFNDFRDNNLPCTKPCYTKAELFSLNDKYDKFICGSDQIWTPTLFDENYFLSFVENDDKKIAYAPSIGLSNIEDDYTKELMRNLIMKIPYLSIREEKGQEMIKDISGRNAELVLDPTLLLTKEEWNLEFNLENFDKKDYVLIYCLGDTSKAYQIAKKLNKEIIIIPKTYYEYDKYHDKVCIPSLIEFLKLIYHANLVITDSFHGTIFSINFNVPFITLKRFKDNKESQNSRIYSILEMMELESRLYSEDNNILYEKVSFENANRILEKKRKFSLHFLENAIESQKRDDKQIITNVCTGCGACAVICPQHCISIKQNEDGFYEYTKEEEKCTHCNLCKKVCGQLHCQKNSITNHKLFSFYSSDDNVLLQSSSGGFGHEVANWGIKNGYSIVGCTYDYDLQRAKHIVISNENDIVKLSGSKYLQSYTIDAFNSILELKQGIIIGTPCQIASLDNLLKIKNRRENFILIDLICHGVPSYLLWKKYLDGINGINSIQFRDKKYGWRSKFLTINGKLNGEERKNLFYHFYNAGNIYNDSCYECNYRDGSCADIRIGDFWGPKFQTNKKGISMIIAFTEKGMSVIDSMKRENFGVFLEEDTSHYLKYQQIGNIRAPYNRKYIIHDFKDEKLSLQSLSKKYYRPYKRKYIVEKNFADFVAFIKKIYRFLRRRERHES